MDVVRKVRTTAHLLLFIPNVPDTGSRNGRSGTRGRGKGPF